jgi:hypothetical protein
MMLLLPTVLPTCILFTMPELLTVPVLGLGTVLKTPVLKTPALEMSVLKTLPHQAL